MSAKWRAIQHRHRYTYSAVIFPSSFTDSLSQSLLPLNPKSLPFFNQLNNLVSLTSIYSQVTSAKNLSSSFTNLLSSINYDDDDASLLKTASFFYLQLLFLENSLPLHRTLVSALSKVSNKDYQSLVCGCFREICEEYGSGDGKEYKSKRFCLSRVALSILGMPKLVYLVDVIEDCAVLVAWDVVLGLDSVLLEIQDWARPSPIVMEQCQEALSCSYYLLQRFPDKFKEDLEGFDGVEFNIMERILLVLISLLKSMAFSRDCFVAAGVSLCAALQVCLSAQELGLFIIQGIFSQTTCNVYGNNCDGGEFRDALLKVPFKGDLISEVGSFSVLSRLCLIRGILTAVSRTVLNLQFVESSSKLNGHEGNGTCASSVKTILYDGILPELCNYCENPIDSHFNFHTLTVMQICLQQMKTSLLANLIDLSDNYDPMPEEMGSRILRIIWNNLEDPLSQTVKQVHQVFDLFLDIQSTLRLGVGSQKIKSFLEKIASDLLPLGSRCKGRYIPLALLTKRLGPKSMLEMCPDLLFETVQAYIDDDVCCAATTFLKCFLECLRDECWNNNGVEEGYAVYRGLCLPPFLYGLTSGVSKLRSNLNTYALPILLEVDVDSIFPMLSFISVGPIGEENGLSFPKLSATDVELGVGQQVAVLVSLFKVCRSLALIEGDIDLYENAAALEAEGVLEAEVKNLYALVCIKGIKVKVPVEWLALALMHSDELLRVDAAESLFLNPKTASLPSHLELTLLKKAVPLNMRSCSTGFQMKWTSLFRKFFSRVRTALERQFKHGSWQPLANYQKESQSAKGTEEALVNRAGDLFNFMRWLSSFLFFSCYPSAPYKRKIMAMELILIMLNVWPIVPPSEDRCPSIAPECSLCPYSIGITSPESALLLVGSIIDSWDRLRESSFRILLYFPTPLPGISSEEMVQRVIAWAKNLVSSPRVRESDAGALTLKLIFRKYVLELGWIVRPSIDGVCFQYQCELVNEDSHIIEPRHPVVEYIKSLIGWLNVAVVEGERDLSEACKNSFVHGVLLTLRYTFDELDWNSDAVMSSILEMREALAKLLGLVMRITSLALWVVSADAWYLPDMDDMGDDDNYLMDELDMVGPSEHVNGDSKHGQDNRPEQIVMVGCWLAMKEVSLLLGTIIRKVPLPSNSCSRSLEVSMSNAGDSSEMSTSIAVLDLKQLEEIGNHFLEVLLKMKHNGAIDKTRAGFTALCNRLLCSNDPRLCKLTESWMDQLMQRTVSKGQTVDDLLRRSAGIPAAFTALFLSEPEGAPKKLLPRALKWLINVANSSLLGPVDTKGIIADSCKFSLAVSDKKLDSAKSSEMHVMEKTSKIRDEGVIPTVHAFNVLRAAFNDTNLATDTSGFSADALIVAIRSFSSPYWEVRNSACLAYTALLRRMIGFLNVQKRESARRALTGLEFFHRYPTLHAFFYNELKVATDMLMDATSGHSESNLAKVVHPSLCPMLILLSRLKPSTIASESGDDLDPFLFMPFIRRCSTQSNLRIRVLASKALMGLVSNEKLPVVLLNIASELPCMKNPVTSSISSMIVNPNVGIYNASFNSIHGMLLQLGSLLDANCRNLADVAKKEKILGDLIEVLTTCSWIASPKWCPCPILNTSFVRALDRMLSIARTGYTSKHFYAIRNLLLELSTVSLDVEDSYGLSYYDPTISELREQAAISYFSCVFQASKVEEILQMPQMHLSPDVKLLNLSETNSFTGLPERLIRSLSDSSYEVRLATLKWLLKFLKSTESKIEVHGIFSSGVRSIQQWNNANLQATMLKLLNSEENHRCMNYILRILSFWNLVQFKKLDGEKCTNTSYVGNLGFDSMCQFWDKLVSLYKLTRHTKTRETLICCMAICVRQYANLLTSYVLANVDESSSRCSASDQLGKSIHLYECIEYFVNVIKEQSSASEPVNMREAAAESIIASGLLEQAELIDSSVFSHEMPFESSGFSFEPKEAVNMYASQVLEIWFLCIKLLEDEDDGVRQALAVNVQKCFSSRKMRSSSNAGEVPTQVEKVIEMSFGYLSSIFGHWINYFEHLSQLVLNSTNYLVPKGDLVRRVFDKEIDNHHEEKLLICQICCSHLEKLPVLNLWLSDMQIKEVFKNYLRRWRMRFYNQLMSFAEDYVEQLGVDWIGGVSNHKDAFLPLYANLLGIYAFSNCIFKGKVDDGSTLLAEVTELGKTLSPLLRNPLISNLYTLVLKSHEKVVGATLDQIYKFTESSIWDGFDPYFLLR
ncbi:thyroid adenoma-associated protein homolog isoform X1 [Ricinus communis]|uniref:thyroid adenoma-associated protein homolog isoform X1 n=2 Tax=Ricinus communis TaxID=3988 RepID=UPI00201A9610|nr:thyroid adenoma-associated protein homolog isoform X1 [Ricinus communis]